MSKCSLAHEKYEQNLFSFIPTRRNLTRMWWRFSSGRIKDGSIIKISMVNGDRLYSSPDYDGCPLPVTLFHHLHDCISIFKVRQATYRLEEHFANDIFGILGSFHRKTLIFFFFNYTEVGGWWGKSTIIVHWQLASWKFGINFQYIFPGVRLYILWMSSH